MNLFQSKNCFGHNFQTKLHKAIDYIAKNKNFNWAFVLYLGRVDVYHDFGSYKYTEDLDKLFDGYPFMSVDAAYTEYVDETTLFILLFKRDKFWKYRVNQVFLVGSSTKLDISDKINYKYNNHDY